MNAPQRKPDPQSVEEVLHQIDAAQANIALALVSALAEIEGVTKDKVNPHFKSKYVDLSSVLDAVRPVFAKYGMAVTQETSPSEDGVIVETVVLHRSGEERRFGKLYVPANKRDAQGAGSALTYARRYSLMTAFGVPAEDDDGNAAVASARPSTGVTRPENSVEDRPRTNAKLDGPYDTVAKLERAAREFARTLRGMGTLQEFDEWAADKEVQAFVEQCKRDLPDWWNGGPSIPPEMVPLGIEVRDTRRGLKQIAELEAQ
jgi:hypothetical protein